MQEASKYAVFAAMAWTLARRDNQLHEAMESRDVIGQAKGMIMERYSIDATQALSMLTRLPQSSGISLAAVAGRVIDPNAM